MSTQRVGTRMTRLLCIALVLVSSTALADGWHRGGRGRWNRQPPQPTFDIERLRILTDACNDAMEGPDNEHRCLDIVSRTRREDVPALVRTCEDAMEGDDNELSCIATMTQTWLSLDAVRACEDAMEGDPNELRCIATVTGSRYEPVGLVRYCEDNESGDEAELACIARWR
jgi:hypothetical protein